jgi:hypothetical protein
MIEFAEKLVGKRCSINTGSGMYKCMIKFIYADFIEVQDLSGQLIYINQSKIIEIKPDIQSFENRPSAPYDPYNNFYYKG